MRALIIGAGGFLGSHLTRAFRQAGHETHGLVRSEARAATLRDAGVQPVLGDATDAASMAVAVRGMDAVIFAAQLQMPEEQAAVAGILAALEGAECAFLFTSGTGVISQRTFGNWSEDTFREDDPFVPQKWLVQRHETENLVRAGAKAELRSMVVRPPLIWGHRGGGKVWSIADSVHKTGAACYIAQGTACYSNVHVDDLARLYVLAAERGVGGALYHAVSGELNNRGVAEAVARNMGVTTRSVTMEEALEIWDKPTAFLSMSVCSRSRSPRARAELGWAPQVTVDLYEDIVNGSYRDLRAGR